MGNQGYSHDATRVAAEIIWSGEIGDVTEVHAWSGRAAGRRACRDSAAEAGAATRSTGTCGSGGARVTRPLHVADDDALPARNTNQTQFGFYLPFNWRGFYDFGSSLIGDWGIHILGPANWALQLAAVRSASSASRRTRCRRSRSPTSWRIK